MYCFDTNVIVDIIKGDKDILPKLEGIAFSPIFITPINLCELYSGPRKIEDVDSLLVSSGIGILDFSAEACRLFGIEYQKLKVKGRLIPEADLMITSIVKAHNLTLVTRDKKHFLGLGIKVEVW